MTASQTVNTGDNLVYTVLAEDVPVLVSVYKVQEAFRIKFGRGIGWDPITYKTKQDALKKLMAYKTYTKVEARLAKDICKKNL